MADKQQKQQEQPKYNYKTIKITQKDPTSTVFYLTINRPTHKNALSLPFFEEFPSALHSLSNNPSVGVIILSGEGTHFCAGIDVTALNSLTGNSPITDIGRASERLKREIRRLQAAVNAVEECRKVVVAAVHGACVGGGVDIVTACDIRYCSKDAWFSVKEVDLGLVADLGSLQRLPGIVGFGNAMEMSLTGRRVFGDEAKVMGLVSGVFGSKVELDHFVNNVAEEIAAKSPLAVTGTKAVLLKNKHMSLEQGLDYVATLNSAMLFSDDLKEATSAFLQKRKPTFSKL